MLGTVKRCLPWATHAAFVKSDERVPKASFGRHEPIGWQGILVSLLPSVALGGVDASSRVEEIKPKFVDLSDKHVKHKRTAT